MANGNDEYYRESLIRLEERVVSMQADIQHIHKKVDDLSKAVHDNEMLVRQHTTSIGKGERLFWLVVSGLIGVVIWALTTGGLTGHVPHA